MKILDLALPIINRNEILIENSDQLTGLYFTFIRDYLNLRVRDPNNLKIYCGAEFYRAIKKYADLVKPGAIESKGIGQMRSDYQRVRKMNWMNMVVVFSGRIASDTFFHECMIEEDKTSSASASVTKRNVLSPSFDQEWFKYVEEHFKTSLREINTNLLKEIENYTNAIDINILQMDQLSEKDQSDEKVIFRTQELEDENDALYKKIEILEKEMKKI